MMNETPNIVMKIFAKNYLAVSLLLIFFVCQNLIAQEFVKPPENLIVENPLKIPIDLKTEIEKAIYRKKNTFSGWSKDGSLIGITIRNRPFFMKNIGEPAIESKFVFPLSRNASLQPKFEENFIYLKDDAGNDIEQLYRYNLKTDSISKITDSSKFEKIGSFRWAEDGQSVYFSSEKKKEGVTEIYVKSLDEETSKLLISVQGDLNYIIKVNSQSLIIKNYSSGKQTYSLLDLKTLKLTTLVSEEKLNSPSFSNSGAGIWFMSNKEGEFYDLYFYDFATKTIQKINDSKLNIVDYSLSPNEKFLALKIEESGTNEIRLFELNKMRIFKELPKPELPPGIIGSFDWKDNEELGFDYNSAKSPTLIKSYNIKTSKIQDWTKSDVDPNLTDKLNDIKLIKWKSFDTREITGYLLEPKKINNQKFPVIINIHGGPWEMERPNFNGFFSYLASNLSVAIVSPNIRGSAGFGDEFEKLDNREKRKNAVKDLEALIAWIKKQPDLDSNKIIVNGVSYGGFMALALGLKEQKRIKAVIAEVPLISIESFLNNFSETTQKTLAQEYGELKNPKDVKNNQDLSILYGDKANRWNIPILMTAGANDTRTPSSDVEKLIEILKARNVPYIYLKSKNAGHNIEDYNSYIYLKLTEYLFLKKYLK
ncbi:MAG: alpha/beta fold hydrolase [Pyrinomonadaceae bacterium]|nr:alpha/beta fold hydrolase [Pyrinomonadaceae bacterium]